MSVSLFILLITTLLSFPAVFADDNASEETESVMLNAQWVDYVVLGCGTGGCTVAGRLAENPGVTVGIIERGKDISHEMEGRPVNMPGFSAVDALNPFIEHMYTNESRETTPADTVKDIYMYPMIALGGATAGYTANWFRPSDEDINAFGIPSITPDLIRYYSNKAETFNDLNHPDFGAQEIANGQRGGSGPLPVTNYPINGTLDVWFSICESVYGLPLLADDNVGPRYGCSQGNRLYGGTLTAPVRVSTYQAYVQPLLSQGNIILKSEARALRIFFRPDRRRGPKVAQCVTYADSSAIGFGALCARREVILASGALATPLLLQNSGVGDPAVLSQFNIPVVINSTQVGKNLNDKVACDVMTAVMTNPQGKPYDGAQAFAFGKTALSDVPVNYMQLMFMKQTSLTNPFAPLVVAVANQIGWGSSYHTGGTVFPKTKDPTTVANIRANHWTVKRPGHTIDRDTEDCTWLTNQTITAIKAFAAAEGATVTFSSPLPADLTSSSSPAQFSAWIHAAGKSGSGDGFQPMSSCRMGSSIDTACVDDKFLVFGTANLRIIDASVIPVPTTGPPSGTVVALAEYLADLLKQKYADEDD